MKYISEHIFRNTLFETCFWEYDCWNKVFRTYIIYFEMNFSKTLQVSKKKKKSRTREMLFRKKKSMKFSSWCECRKKFNRLHEAIAIIYPSIFASLYAVGCSQVLLLSPYQFSFCTASKVSEKVFQNRSE